LIGLGSRTDRGWLSVSETGRGMHQRRTLPGRCAHADCALLFHIVWSLRSSQRAEVSHGGMCLIWMATTSGGTGAWGGVIAATVETGWGRSAACGHAARAGAGSAAGCSRAAATASAYGALRGARAGAWRASAAATGSGDDTCVACTGGASGWA